MTVAQNIKKQIKIVKQAGLGVPGTTGSQIRRRTSGSFKADRDTFKSAEIVSHQQSTGVSYGVKKPNGKISGYASPATYKDEYAALLRAPFVTGVNSTALITLTAAALTGAMGTITRSVGSFLTDGFKLFDVVRSVGWAGAGATNNNAKNLFIIALTATVMTVTTFDNSAFVADPAGDSVTITVVGKKVKAPLTGHTNDYFSVEEWYPDLSKSELYIDQQPSKVALGIPATGQTTVAFDWVGLARTLGVAEVLTAPLTETTTPQLTALNAIVMVNGVATVLTGATVNISGNVATGTPEIGSNTLSDNARGTIEVDGSITATFTSTILQQLYEGQTPISLAIALMDTTAPLSSFMTLVMPRIKITSDPADDSAQIARTYNFTAEINSAGGVALASDQTILSIQDSDA